MRFEIRKAGAFEAPALAALESSMFPSADCFTADQWARITSFWILVNDRIAGSIGLEHDSDGGDTPCRGALYVASIGLLPRFRGKGLGNLAQQWEIDYARKHGVGRIVAHCRESNAASLRLHQKFGFRRVGKVPGFYHDPEEAAITLELLLL